MQAPLLPQFMIMVVLKDINLFLNADVQHWSITTKYQVLSRKLSDKQTYTGEILAILSKPFCIYADLCFSGEA